MFSNQAKAKSKQPRPARSGKTNPRRLYSVAAWPEQRAFVGTLSAGGTDYRFSYAPSHAEAINNRLQLTGPLTLTGARGRSHTLKSVRATLANTQGGIGRGPIRRQMSATGAPPRDHAQEVGSLPVTENTGRTSYCGVLYFHFEPLDAGALGVAADLTTVQLNVRLEPLDDAAITLHGLYCDVVDALYGEEVDQKVSAAAITELNRIFAG